MSSYHFPIILGQNQSERIIMIHLVDEEENYEENRVVITSTANRTTPLFRISDEVNLISIDGSLVKPSFDKGQNLVEVMVGIDRIEPKRTNGLWNYRVETGRFDNIVSFRAVLNEDGIEKEFEGSLHIVRPAAGDTITRINADLGSDATQINYFVPRSGDPIESIHLVECMTKAYYPDSHASGRRYDLLDNPENGEPLYIQQEQNNVSFYKTGNITFQVDGIINAPIRDDKTFINYINVSAAGQNEAKNASKGGDTWDKEINFNRKLINIKILYAHHDMNEVVGAVNGITYRDGAMAKSVSVQRDLLQVLHTIYKQLLEISTKNVPANCKLFSVLLLVPNIYVQENIDLLLYELNKMNNNDTGLKYDFRIISESDSAFIGIKEVRRRGATKTILSEKILDKVKNPRQKDTFLIIDAGKGTTDYSIIRYDSDPSNNPNNNIVSMKRGGIVGAGGAIDYVFVRVFARQVYNHLGELGIASPNVEKEVFVRRFMTMITKLAPDNQDRIMLYVELLKKEYRKERDGAARVYTCFAKANAKTIVESLLKDRMANADFRAIVIGQQSWKEVAEWEWDNQFVSFDSADQTEVEWVCDSIAKTIIDEMIFAEEGDTLTKQIDYVVFNGRSFLFKPLKDAFIDMINKHRGVWYENVGLRAYFPKYLLSDKDKNLKEAPLTGFNMKSVSVLFDEHDLGVNCNSDLCCMDRIELAGVEIFGQDQFWNGFTALSNTGAKVKHYYIGYKSGDNISSFAPLLRQSQNDVQLISDLRKDLVMMTLFPVSYENVACGSAGTGVFTQPGSTTSTMNTGGHSTQGGQNVPNTSTPANPSNPNPPTPSDLSGHIDINDL